MAKIRVLACSGGSWGVYGGVMEYRPLETMRRVLEISYGLTYSQLRNRVLSKLGLATKFNDDLRLTYQLPLISSPDHNKSVVVEIADDEDVNIFMDVADTASHGLVTLYFSKPEPGPGYYSD